MGFPSLHEVHGRNLTMGDLAIERVHWTIRDLDFLPDNGNRYEIVDGELLMSKAPDIDHQWVCFCIARELNAWSDTNKTGRAYITPGIVFDEASKVIPDVIWVSKSRLRLLRDPAGHLTGAPEIVIEVLSPGLQNELRDRQAKLKLYDVYGVQEYWIVDSKLLRISVYHREQQRLHLAATLLVADTLTSPLLPGFACPVRRLVPEDDE